jgi:hypothetical protein
VYTWGETWRIIARLTGLRELRETLAWEGYVAGRGGCAGSEEKEREFLEPLRRVDGLDFFELRVNWYGARNDMPLRLIGKGEEEQGRA